MAMRERRSAAGAQPATSRPAPLGLARRRLLAGSAAAGLVLAAGPARAQPALRPEGGLRPEPSFPLTPRTLQPPMSLEDQLRRGNAATQFLVMRNPNTGETIDVTFQDARGFLGEALSALDRFCRDWRAEAVVAMDRALFSLLAAVQRRAEFREIEMLSAYRTPATNAWLATLDYDVARNSLHMQGRAIDFRIPGVALADLADWATEEGAGGLGIYPASGFVHVDTGPRRRWRGRG